MSWNSYRGRKKSAAEQKRDAIERKDIADEKGMELRPQPSLPRIKWLERPLPEIVE